MVKIENKRDLLDNAFSPQSRKAREIVLNAIEKALEAVDPKGIIKPKVNLTDNLLKVDNHIFDLSAFEKIFVVGGGKASGSMAEALEEILGDRVEEGLVVVPHGTASKHNTKRIKLHEAGHPIPDSDSVEGARRIINLVDQAGEKDLIICLISGGGSSLMTLPRIEIDLHDKQKMTEMLLKSGANIREINTIRKHISEFKGGLLAKKAYPATIISLIISDVIGDLLDVIASGPTFPDSTTFQDAISILKNYGLWEKSPKTIRKVLRKGEKGLISETPKSGEEAFKKVYNSIIGNNRLACSAAINYLRQSGLNTLFLTSFMEGEARDIGFMLAALTREVITSGNPVSTPAAIITGGETTVTVTGKGIGGRNQEIVLGAALRISGTEKAVIASISTDGIDGPTDAAGALVDGDTLTRSSELNMNPIEYLRNNDSYSFFSRLNNLIFTGPTGTNVNDLSIVIVL